MSSPAYSMSSLTTLRNASIFFIALLAFQFWLGISINTELELPVMHLSGLESLSYYGGHFVFILMHEALALLLLITAVFYLRSAVKSHIRSVIITGLVGVFSVAGAIALGLLYLMTGQFFGWSVGMMMSAVSALIDNAVGLYLIGIRIGRASAE